MSILLAGRDLRPWYLEPWPWILMGLPLTAVVGSLVAAWIAFSHVDALVVDNYYKEGLGINRVLAQDETARRLGCHATLGQAGHGRLEVTLSGLAGQPATLVLSLIHPVDPTADRRLSLSRSSSGHYVAEVLPSPGVRWQVQLEDSAHQWRLTGDWQPGPVPLQLHPRGGGTEERR
jgi:uncharacterized protein